MVYFHLFKKDTIYFLIILKAIFEYTEGKYTFLFVGHAALTLRSRLRCIILKKDDSKAPPPTNLLVLNEVVIDRGPSSYLSNIDLYLDGKRITSVQGDGEL